MRVLGGRAVITDFPGRVAIDTAPVAKVPPNGR